MCNTQSTPSEQITMIEVYPVLNGTSISKEQAFPLINVSRPKFLIRIPPKLFSQIYQMTTPMRTLMPEK